MTLLAVALLGTAAVSAQSAAELAKQQRELNKINMEMLNAKPSKDAKKQAKQLKKDGWVVPAGSSDMAKQITRAQLMEQELMADKDGNPMPRYTLITAIVTSGTASAGYAAARAQAQLEIASMLETKVAAGMQGKLDNAQGSAIDATTVDKFNQRSKAIFNNTLSNMTTVLHIYRVLPNNNYQVQVRIAYDKKVMQAKLKRLLQEQLEKEGDEFGEEVDDIIDNALKEI